MKKQLIRTSALTLAVIIMLCPFCVCFADSEIGDYVAGQDLLTDQLAYYIWLTLRVWGISVEFDETTNYVDQAGAWLIQEFWEFLDSIPSNSRSWQETIFPWRFHWDSAGNLVGNTSFLQDMQNFVDYLTGQYNLTNNSEKILRPEVTIGGYSLYETNQLYACYNPNSPGSTSYVSVSEKTNQVGQSTNLYSCYWLVRYDPNQNVGYQYTAHLISFDNNSGNQINFHYQRWTDQGNNASENGRVSLTGPNNNGLYWSGPAGNAHDWIPYNCVPFQGDSTAFSQFMNGNVTIQNSGSEKIVTETILPPDEDSSYTSGDSIVITGDTDGDKFYVEIEWPDSISVDNLPAIVSTGNIRALDLVSVFAPIKAFANTFSDGFDLMVQIVYNMPTAIVSIALTIMSAIAVFGTIKIFKEH